MKSLAWSKMSGTMAPAGNRRLQFTRRPMMKNFWGDETSLQRWWDLVPLAWLIVANTLEPHVRM
jgi:hypothetical protein